MPCGGSDRWGSIGTARLPDQTVAIVVKRTAAGAALHPERFAGHSLRAGLAMAAALPGAPEHALLRQTRQRSVDVFHDYVRVVTLFKKNAAGAVGL